MIIILSVVLSISTLLYSEIKVIKNMGNSAAGLYAADSGIEKVLYYDKQVLPNNAIRGLCSIYPYNAISSPNACPENGDVNGLDPSIYCNNATPMNPLAPNGCDLNKCDNCSISFSTTLDNGATYFTTAKVSPDGTSSSLEIKSKGVFGGIEGPSERQIEVLNAPLQSQPQGPIEIKNAYVTPTSVSRGTTITISAEVSVTSSSDTVGTVKATIFDLHGNAVVPEIDLVTSDPQPWADNIWTGTWSTNNRGAYYVSITATDTASMPSETIHIDTIPGESFEVYFPGEYPYPLASNPSVSLNGNNVIITADIEDVSGVYFASAEIEDPINQGHYMNEEYGVIGAMYDDGAHGDGAAADGIYGAIIDVSDTSIWIPGTIYLVDISTTDNLNNNSLRDGNYIDVGNFTIPNL